MEKLLDLMIEEGKMVKEAALVTAIKHKNHSTLCKEI
jgi:hypothetical protein